MRSVRSSGVAPKYERTSGAARALLISGHIGSKNDREVGWLSGRHRKAGHRLSRDFLRHGPSPLGNSKCIPVPFFMAEMARFRCLLDFHPFVETD